MDIGETPEAQFGTATHAAGVALLLGSALPPAESHDPSLAAAWADHIREIWRQGEGAVEVAVEVFAGIIGTADFIGYIHNGRALHVWDLKTGHLPVEAVGNPQLLCYLAGALQRWPHALNVVLGIYQPHDFGRTIKTWEMSVDEAKFSVEALRMKAERAQSPGATCQTGQHCRYCDGRLNCKAFVGWAAGALEVHQWPRVAELTPDQLGQLYGLVEQAEARLRTLKDTAGDLIKELIQQGQPVKGWTVDRGPGRRYWSAPAGEIEALGKFIGAELVTKQPITITAADKAVPAALRSALAPLQSRSEGALTLKRFKPPKEFLHE
jgi:hypothetical protein